MSDFYDDLAATAVELLEELGQEIALARGGLRFSAAGVALDYAQRDIDGSRIKWGDRRVYVAPDLGTAPVSGDQLRLADGTVLLVIASRPLAPDGTIVLHDVQVRGA
ncbi:hypothetical protein GT347_20300 [Xylophilus rhododendri]|uniref:Uncharacterized protein n=1 Tax=Xylophilus rhododendri TaxID=2697032 RepID=A0A857JA68_9BURK|nr:hypothetical protein [Xylophilus rhododendri]QHJ00114.1 hypothetical protein GT347_20300 [Xylophilus rhododendri]